MANTSNRYAKLARDFEVGNGVPYNRKKVIECVKRAAAECDGCAIYITAQWALCGVDEPIDRLKASRLYQQAAANGCACATFEAAFHGMHEPVIGYFHDSAPSDSAASTLAFVARSTFGFGSPYSASDAKKHFRWFDNKPKSHAYYMSKALIEHVSKHARFVNLFRSFFSSRNKGLLEVGDLELDALWAICEHFQKEVAITFMAFTSIAANDAWRNLASWRRRALKSEVSLLGISTKDLAISQKSIGLPQNIMSPDGILRPGQFVTPANNSCIWLSDLEGITFLTKGEEIYQIRPVGSRNKGRPALITRDDFLVALCLAFDENGSSDDIGISLDKPPSHFVSPLISDLMYKNFSPTWLASTEFGGSLYCADLMSGRFNSSRGLISFINPLDIHINDDSNRVRGHFMQYSPNHSFFESGSARICMKLSSIQAEIIHTMEKNEVFLRSLVRTDMILRKIDFSIDGSGMTHNDRGRDISYVNDPRRPEAHQGLTLTNRLPELELAFPVFRRVKYLFALTRLLIDVRRSGLRLSRELMDVVERTKMGYVEQSKRLCLHVAACG